MKQIAIFASGAGSNAQKIIEFAQNHNTFNVGLVYANKTNAKVLNIAQQCNVLNCAFPFNESNTNKLLDILSKNNIEYIVLAGFLKKIPKVLIDKFPNKIINIHPALLPSYGGNGMYGKYVHQAVFNNNEKFSGITIHYVNQNYDEGNIIFQAKVDVSQCASVQEIQHAVLELEHKNYPKIIEQVVNQH